MADLRASIEELWERRDDLSPADPDAATLVEEAIDLLDPGQARVAEVDRTTDEVVVHEWLKKAILLLFSLRGMETIEHGPFEYADKLPLKHGFAEAGVRVVPGASARWGSFLGRGVVLMPCYVNIGAWVGAGSMVDTWATVASCAQIGERVHLAGGVGIGGVLEPPNAVPVVVEDDAFIGSRCMVTDGARRSARESVLGARELPRARPSPSSTQRPARRSRRGDRAAVVRGRSGPAAGGPVSRRRVLRCPACCVIKRLDEGRAPRQGAAQRGPARPRRQHLSVGHRVDLLAVTADRGRPVREPSRSGARRPRRSRRCAPDRVVARRADGAQRGGRTRTRADRREWCWPDTSTPSRRSATRCRARTATRCGGVGAPT